MLKKTIEDIILNDEMFTTPLLILDVRWGGLYQHFHSTFSRGLSAVIMVRERRMEKEDISLLFSDGMVVNVNNLKDSTNY